LKIIGITGTIGAGKTSVAKMFARWGAKAINADQLSHQALRVGTPVYRRVCRQFKEAVLTKDKKISRVKLAQLVFANQARLTVGQARLKKLCAIVHPWVIRQIQKKFKQIQAKDRKAIVVLDAPLLLEAGLAKKMHYIIVVTASRKKRKARYLKKKQITSAEFFRREKNQLPQKIKLRQADFIIDNGKSLAQTKTLAKAIWRKIQGED
jgi:dephospho-CoA kinase